MDEDLDPDGAFEDDQLRHMGWCDQVSYEGGMKIWIPTVHAVPGPPLCLW